MPIAFDPDEVVAVSLKSDLKVPEERRPSLEFKFLTSRERRKVFAAYDRAVELEKLRKSDEAEAALEECLKIGLRGARHWPEGYESAPLEALTAEEKWELAGAYPAAVSLSEAERRGFVSPRPSLPDSDAAAAVEVGGSVNPASAAGAPVSPNP
jgi:hypothetical protein